MPPTCEATECREGHLVPSAYHGMPGRQNWSWALEKGGAWSLPFVAVSCDNSYICNAAPRSREFKASLGYTEIVAKLSKIPLFPCAAWSCIYHKGARA